MSRPPRTWKCRWNTLCPALSPQLETTRNSASPSSFVTLEMTSKQCPTMAAFSAVTAPQEGICSLGMTRDLDNGVVSVSYEMGKM